MESISAPDNMCANCGKGEEKSDNLKKCSACLSVKYCSRECQAAHRPMHKKACKKRAAELYDEKLFKDVEPEECPICFQPLPLESGTATFESCCGKRICCGCIYTMAISGGKDLCAFCRTPGPTSYEEQIKRTKKLTDRNDPYAFYFLGSCYATGELGLPQDEQKANELWLKAGELGCHEAYHNLGNSCRQGLGVEVDMKKAKYYYELAAMMGSIAARYNLGMMELKVDNNRRRAYKHYVVAAKAGDKDSLDMVKQGYMNGIVTKDEYANTLRAYQHIQDEMKSDARDKAAIYYEEEGLFSS